MLTIPRKQGESVIIGDNIIVTVVEIRGDEVQLSIEYPPEAWDRRQEGYEAFEREAMLVPQAT